MFKTSSLTTNTLFTCNVWKIQHKFYPLDSNGFLNTFLCERVHYLAKFAYLYSKTLRLYCSNLKSIKTESLSHYVEGRDTYSNISHLTMSTGAPLALDGVASLLVVSCCTLMAPCPVKDGRRFQHLRIRGCQCLELVVVYVSRRDNTTKQLATL